MPWKQSVSKCVGKKTSSFKIVVFKTTVFTADERLLFHSRWKTFITSVHFYSKDFYLCCPTVGVISFSVHLTLFCPWHHSFLLNRSQENMMKPLFEYRLTSTMVNNKERPKLAIFRLQKFHKYLFGFVCPKSLWTPDLKHPVFLETLCGMLLLHKQFLSCSCHVVTFILLIKLLF